jgi:hypothetical protein
MSSAGPNVAGTGTSVSTGNGTGNAWATPSNITADDGTLTTLATGSTQAQFLTATNFGFAIPGSSTIIGLVFSLERFRGTTRLLGGGIFDGEVFAVKGGTNQTSTRANGIRHDWGTTTGVVESYGSPYDLWGAAWTDTDINASNFGVAFSPKQASATASVDVVKATVYYLTSAPTTAVATTGTGANDASTGSQAWSNAGNITAEDATYATATLSASTDTQYLKATNFGFSIPSGATINGIGVRVKKRSTNGEIIDLAVRLVKGGTIGSTDASQLSRWFVTTPDYHYYGGATDLWGDTWTDTDINASNFGMALRAQWENVNSAQISDVASVDVIKIEVFYTGGGGGGGGTACKQEAMGVIRSW